MQKKALFILVKPIQNVRPYILLHKDCPDLNIMVAYCSLPSQAIRRDQESANMNAFDYPMLSRDYPWKVLRNYSPRPGTVSFFGLVNWAIIKEVWRHDVITVYGHAYFSFVLAIICSRLFGKKLIVSTDATYLESPDQQRWKERIKKILFPWFYNKVAHRVIVPSTTSVDFLTSLGVKPFKIKNTFYSVDNDYIEHISRSTDVSQIRQKLQIPSEAFVFVFCAKFIPRKRPQDAIQAFAEAGLPASRLLMTGDGPMMQELKTLVKQLSVEDTILFPGLVKYSQLPQYYTAANALVFTSETEQFGLPINEAMICGIPVLVSDRIGARNDLVDEGITGHIFCCGDTLQLSELMRKMAENPEQACRMGKAGQKKITHFSSQLTAKRTYETIEEVLKGTKV